ncbi:hypothetical protein ABIE06_004497 [Pantoea dispersa]
MTGAEDDELINSTYWEACRITGMICLSLADRGQETHREKLIWELVTLAEACIGKNEDCNPSLIFAIEQLRTQSDDVRPCR